MNKTSISSLMQGSHISIIFLILSIMVLVLAPLLYIGNFAGDSQVHLIYGENAAKGNMFEFNVGEKSAGVTSPGYMLFIASLFKVWPDSSIPIIIKFTNILAWFAHLLFVFFMAKRILGNKCWAWVATFITGMIPGSVYNATNGMESGIFALIVAVWLYIALRTNWFNVNLRSSSIHTEILLGSLLGLACWIRPEAFIIAFIALMFRLIYSKLTFTNFQTTVSKSMIFLLPFVIISGSLIYFHLYNTGHIIPISGVSRILMSNISTDTFPIGPLYVSSRLITRLIAYFPLSLLWSLTILLIWSKQIPHLPRTPLIILIVFFLSIITLYSLFIGSIHISRYVIFAMPAFVILATVSAQWLWDYKKLTILIKSSVITLACLLLTVFALETQIRLGLDSQDAVFRTMRAPIDRESTSNSLYELLGKPSDFPISIGLQEVQLRYWLDDRFIVRSLDGRVDPVLIDHASRESVDHIGYFKDRQVNYLLDIPSYNRSEEMWSLQNLSEMDHGESVLINDIKITRMPITRPVTGDSISVLDTHTKIPAQLGGPSYLHWFLKVLYKIDYD